MHGSLAAAGLSASFSGLLARRAGAREYGALVPDPAGILDLPEGFSYVVLQQRLDSMDDGYVVPGAPDGMACFEADDGTWVLMRNHEVSLGLFTMGPYGAGEAPPEAYDPDGYGGVTRVVIDPDTLAVVSSNLVLTGTVRNCAGGPSPWGWLSCEENVDGDHGYVFACPIDAASVLDPDRIDGYGRFNHEAAAVDPETMACYLTEDRGDGCLYRFMPDDPASPFAGTLQALRVIGQDALETATGLSVGDELMCDWVDVDDPTPADDTVRVEAQAAGAAVFSRGEGIWYYEGEIYFACTNGGPAGLGQIFLLTDGPAGATLTLVAQSESADVLDFPDNVTVSPWGQVFIAEDGDGDQFLRAISDAGDVVPFARNAVSDSELAGVCFSPDGRALFVNIQGDGLTLMVTGPFPETEPGGADETGGSDETGDPDDTGTPGDSADGTGAASTGGGPTGGDGSDTGSGADGGAQDGGDGGGCGCTTGAEPAAGLLASAAALGVGLVARRAPQTDGDRDPDPT